MGLIADLFKELPLSAVMRERVALAEEKARAIEDENERLRAQVYAWKTKCSDLEAELKTFRSVAEFVRFRGLLWRREGGAFEPFPYCARCQVPMTAFPPEPSAEIWTCSSCDGEVPYSKPPAA